MCCLGAIIQVSLISLFDLKPFKRAYKVRRREGGREGGALWCLYLYYLPMCCLGAIIQVSLISLFDSKPFKRAYKVRRREGGREGGR